MSAVLGREETAFEWMYRTRMEAVADMPVTKALASGLVVKCPTCGIIHPGIHYMHPDHRQYCGTLCFKGRGLVKTRAKEPPNAP